MTPQQSEIYATLKAQGGPLTLGELGELLPQIAPGSIRKQTSRLASQGAVTRAHDGRYVVAPSRPETTPETGAQAAPGLDKIVETETARRPVPLLPEIPVYRRVEDALPIGPLRAVFRLAIALAFVRSQQLDGCQAPAIALAGEPGTGKTTALRAAALLLTGHGRDVTDARQLTSKPQVIGRRQQTKDGYTLTPSVLLYPPDREPPALVCLDEVGEAKGPVLDGASTLLRLEPDYDVEGVRVEVRAAVTMTYNKPDGVSGYWQPFGDWPGAPRRMLVCDLDPYVGVLLGGAAKRSTREVYSILGAAQLPALDLGAYRTRAAFPPQAALESLDELVSAVFVAPHKLPVNDPVLRGLCAAYAALWGHTVEAALTSALADVATVVGTTHGTLKPGAGAALNKALRSHDLPPVELPRVDEPPARPQGLTLTPEQRQRIAAYLARYATRPTPELLTTLDELGLARRERRLIRLPRFVLELLTRPIGALVFTLGAAVHNVAIAPALRLPRVSGRAVSSAWAWAVSRPKTALVEYVTTDGAPLDRPRLYVIDMFAGELGARQTVALEDAEHAGGLEDAA